MKITYTGFLVAVLMFAITVNAKEKQFLSDGPDVYLDYPNILDIRICQEEEITDIVPGFNLTESDVEFSPGINRFAYALSVSEGDEPLFYLECADFTGAVVEGKWASWPDAFKFRGVTWVRTWNPDVIGPAGAVVGKTVFGDMKNLNWVNTEHREFSGCTKIKDMNVISCMSTYVIMEFNIPNDMNPDGTEDVSDDVMDQAVLANIQVLRNEFTRDSIPASLAGWLAANGHF